MFRQPSALLELHKPAPSVSPLPSTSQRQGAALWLECWVFLSLCSGTFHYGTWLLYQVKLLGQEPSILSLSGYSSDLYGHGRLDGKASHSLRVTTW